MTRGASLLVIGLMLAAVQVATAQQADVPVPRAAQLGPSQHGIGVALKGGTLGAGLEFSKSLSGRLGARVGVNYFSYAHSVEQEVVRDNFEGRFTIDGAADMFSMSLLADFYPLKKVFRLSAGLVYNGNVLSVAAAPSDSIRVTMNDADVYRGADEVGDVAVDITWNKLRPYFGVGLGNAAVGKRINLLLDLGVIYAGGPNVEITTTEGSMLERNRDNGPIITENLDKNTLYRLYPVLSLGFSVRL